MISPENDSVPSSLPSFRVRTFVEKSGRGEMVFTFSRSLFKKVLEHYNVVAADNLMADDDNLRDLVARFSRQKNQRLVDELDIEQPGGVRCLANEVGIADSNDAKRQDLVSLALDPSRSVVNVELRVFEMPDHYGKWENMTGLCVLRTTVGPPAESN